MLLQALCVITIITILLFWVQTKNSNNRNIIIHENEHKTEDQERFESLSIEDKFDYLVQLYCNKQNGGTNKLDISSVENVKYDNSNESMLITFETRDIEVMTSCDWIEIHIGITNKQEPKELYFTYLEPLRNNYGDDVDVPVDVCNVHNESDTLTAHLETSPYIDNVLEVRVFAPKHKKISEYELYNIVVDCIQLG